jgi:hypothetical protein
MMTPTARSMTFPRITNALNSFHIRARSAFAVRRSAGSILVR